MTVFADAIRQVQNPALGAMLQWGFAVGFEEARQESPGCPIPLLFLPLPMLLHQETAELIAGTQKTTGLRGFAAKFSKGPRNDGDLLLGLHKRAMTFRELSLESLRIAVTSRLLIPGADPATVFALSRSIPRKHTPESVRKLHRSAEKLGQWCGELTLFEIAQVLKLRL